MTLVIDASAAVAALVDDGPDGRWAEELIAREALAAPHLMPVEVGNILRRASLSHQLSSDSAALAHEALQTLRVELYPYSPVAGRVWQLRANLTAYDAWYVALAESLDAVLVTLDERLIRAAGPRCAFARLPSEQ